MTAPDVPDLPAASRRDRLRAAVRAAGSVPRGWWAWTSDYAYVGWRQVRGFVAPGDPARYATGDAVPVVLLPGIYETWFFLEPLARALHDAGHPVVTVPGLRYNTAELDDSARLVARRLAELGLDRVVLVAHSKGGLIGKHLMSQQAPGPVALGTGDGPRLTGPGSGPRPTAPDRSSAPSVVGMVALNTPFAGSRYATYFPSRPVRALSPRFPAMLSLAREVVAHGRIVSVYGLFDPHVPGGSALAGATNVQLPVMGHFRTVAHPLVHRAVVEHVARLDSTGGSPAQAPAPRDDDAAT